MQFLSTLSLRRATEHVYQLVLWVLRFLSTLSLRRATSIKPIFGNIDADFYPRSPCGERRTKKFKMPVPAYFYPRSPCGERQANAVDQILPGHISIHALLAESDYDTSSLMQCQVKFLSTLSLRRATLLAVLQICPPRDFYPRSPCGERQ